jgi:hypothetical protein
MAHVHGEKAMANMMKPAAEAANAMGSATETMGRAAMEGTGHMMMGSATETMGKAAMDGMGSMMMGSGMAEAMRRAARPAAVTGMATGAALTASTTGGRSAMSKIVRHPLVLFGLGVAVGYLVHKYRKEIISTAAQIGEKGKDFVLQQRENLEDIVAESREAGEDAGDKPK